MRLAKLAGSRQAILVLSDLSAQSRRQFLHFIGETEASGPDLCSSIRLVSDMDEALQWCEDQLLAGCSLQGDAPALTTEAEAQTPDSLDKDAQEWTSQYIAKAGDYLQRESYPAGAILWQDGDESVRLYIVESGEIELASLSANGLRKRHFSIGSGYVIGEVFFFLKSPRIGTAIVSHDAVLYSLAREQLDAMARQKPQLALELQNQMLVMEAMLLAEDFHSVDFMMR
jgi:SulP family sulfate permease